VIIDAAIYDGFYKTRALPLSAQSCTNFYPTLNKLSNGEVISQSLIGTPGTTLLATTGTLNQISRGAWTFQGKAYFVNGTGLYRLNADLTLSAKLGTIAGTSRVSMADNGTQLLILVPGGAGYIFTTGADNLASITDGDFDANGNPLSVLFMDGYFVLTTDTKKFIVSALNNGLAYNALDFGSAEYNPDGTVAPFRHKSTLFIFGTETGEAFSNIGGVSFPFQRQQGFVLSKGLAAAFSIIPSQETFMFIGNGRDEGPAVWALAGNSTQKVSTEAIDALLEAELAAGTLADVFAYAYSQEGAYFVCWSLTDTTIVLDSTTMKWHERKSEIVSGGSSTITSQRTNSMCQAYGLLLVGDSIDGRIGKCDLDIYTEYGEIIEREIAGRPFTNQGLPFSVPMIEVKMDAGVGNAEAVNPMMRMDRSKNGKQFSGERARSVGKVGEYDHRVVWRRNGRVGMNETFRFKFAEKAKAVIVKIMAEVI
jgi:hypothetical protein